MVTSSSMGEFLAISIVSPDAVASTQSCSVEPGQVSGNRQISAPPARAGVTTTPSVRTRVITARGVRGRDIWFLRGGSRGHHGRSAARRQTGRAGTDRYTRAPMASDLRERVPGSVPDARGRFGPYGGRYVPEVL